MAAQRAGSTRSSIVRGHYQEGIGIMPARGFTPSTLPQACSGSLPDLRDAAHSAETMSLAVVVLDWCG
jgi:hypothetical protein